MKLESLRDLFIDELKDVYDAENQITKALPKMIKAASNSELQNAFQEHLAQTQEHIRRLEQVFEQIGETAKRKTCDGMKGLLEEGKELMEEDAEDAVMDAGLIAGAQRVEHYEMAAYGSLKTWATQLGEEEAAELLEETLNEEKEADEKLTEIAESSVNAAAAEGEEEGEESEAGGGSSHESETELQEVGSRAARSGRPKQDSELGSNRRR